MLDEPTNPIKEQPETGTEQGADGKTQQILPDDADPGVILKEMVTREGLKSKPFPWGKENKEWTVESLLTVANSARNTQEERETLKRERENWTTQREIEIAKGVADTLIALGIPTAPDDGSSTQPPEQPDNGTPTGTQPAPASTTSTPDVNKLVEERIKHLTPQLQTEIVKGLGFNSLEEFKAERDTFRQDTQKFREQMNREFFERKIVAEHPILKWKNVGDHEEPENPVAFAAWEHLVREKKVDPVKAAEMVDGNYSSFAEQNYKTRLQQAIDAGEMAPPPPRGSLPKPEKWDGVGGVSSLFKREVAESENDSIAPPGVTGPWRQ